MKCQPIREGEPISFKGQAPATELAPKKLITIKIQEQPKMDVFKKCPPENGQE